MADSEIHVGDGRSKFNKERFFKRFLASVGLVVLVAAVAGGAGAGFRWWQQEREYKRASQPDAISKETNEVQDLALGGDFDKAHGAIDEALDNPSLSDQAKHDLYLQQGVTYENQKKYDEALESYQKAEAAMESMQSAQSIARMYEQKGDKSSAITYYKKAITLIPEDETMRDALKRYFENTIIVLEGGEPNYE